MKTLINIKADKEVKENAKKLAKDLGLSLSAIINAYLKEFVRNRAVYFSHVPRMSRGLEALIGKVERDIEEKKNMSRSFSSLSDAIGYLDSL